MSTFRTFDQNGKVEPFFHSWSTMVTVGNIHSSNNCNFTINQQNFMMQPQTHLKSFCYKSRRKFPEKNSCIFNFLNQFFGKTAAPIGIKKKINSYSSLCCSYQCIYKTPACFIIINNICLEMNIMFCFINYIFAGSKILFSASGAVQWNVRFYNRVLKEFSYIIICFHILDHKYRTLKARSLFSGFLHYFTNYKIIPYES